MTGGKRIHLLRLAAGLLTLALLTACSGTPQSGIPQGSDSTTQGQPLPQMTENGRPAHLDRGFSGANQETLKVALANPANLNLNPFMSGQQLFPVDPQGYYQPLYETLLSYDPVSLDYLPVLADSVHEGEDFLRIILPQGRTWQDGYPVTAEDVIFSIQAHRKYRTAAGEILNLYVAQVTNDFNSIQIHVRETRENASVHCMEALSHLLILPRHLWEPLVSAAPSLDALPEGRLPLVGSGPWALWQEDDYALTLIRASGTDGEDLTRYLVIVKYAQTLFSEQALVHGDIDVLLGRPGPDFAIGNGEVQDLYAVFGGERVCGITVNPTGNPLLNLRSFRRLLSLAVDPQILWVIPSTASLLHHDSYSSLYLEPDQETIDRLAGEAGLNKEPGALFYLKEDNPLPLISLTFPDNQPEAEERCRAFADAAKTLGIPVSLKSLPEEEWRRASLEGNFELIYTESSIDESYLLAATRLTMNPGFEGQVAGRQLELDVRAADELIASFQEAGDAGDLRPVLDRLTGWVITEGLFLPFEAGKIRAGLWNGPPDAGDLSSIFRVKTSLEQVGGAP